MRTTLIVSLLIVAVCAMMFGDSLVEADEYEYHGPGWGWSANPPGFYDPPDGPTFRDPAGDEYPPPPPNPGIDGAYEYLVRIVDFITAPFAWGADR